MSESCPIENCEKVSSIRTSIRNIVVLFSLIVTLMAGVHVFLAQATFSAADKTTGQLTEFVKCYYAEGKQTNQQITESRGKIESLAQRIARIEHELDKFNDLAIPDSRRPGSTR